MSPGLALDHVIYGTLDLTAAAHVFEARHGLASYEGGRHRGLGTGNRIVPLGDAYVELMGVVDAEEARVSPLATWLRAQTEAGDRPVAWCVRTDDLDAVAERLGLTPVAMQRERPDGSALSWRLAGLERAMGDGAVPFFIQWDAPEGDLPGRVPAAHPSAAVRLAWIEVGGDVAEIESWLGSHDLPLRVGEGSGVLAVGVETPDGEIIVV